MPFRIDQKLVVGVSTNALFNLEAEDKIFREQGLDAYKKFQKENKDVLLEKGLAYPFVRRFLNINTIFPEKPVEVVLLSRNSVETGLRVFNSIKSYGLDISRAAFTSGRSPFEYIPAFNISLFLSTNDEDVKNAINRNYPAGRILNTVIHDDEKDPELRIAFDFDGVLADDAAEQVYQRMKTLTNFMSMRSLTKCPLNPGLLLRFFQSYRSFKSLKVKEQRKIHRTKEY